MPKITRHGGPSDADADAAAEAAQEPRKDTHVPEEPETEQEPQEPAQGPQDQYDDMTVAELREELARRELDKTGKKPELVVRLREDDVRKAD
ncbi:SAP domain-containing protein [Streptomyces sp. NBC_01343]|uniref:SAP domain-containing protein n=1 Tax=Streptomyces sp. NBC_01343 TaxID=2903832 RepID=UPI002E111827|nr:SAP domain-containing protein [Streptomyces sp. NBC_01343]